MASEPEAVIVWVAGAVLLFILSLAAGGYYFSG